MILPREKMIDPSSLVSEIVMNDYRTADVFRKHGIDFCCGGKWPLHTVCEMKGIEVAEIKIELEKAARNISIPASVSFEEWDIDFLTDYIVKVHHKYLKHALPLAKDYLVKFTEGHVKKFSYLPQLVILFNDLEKEILPHLIQEEEIIFPYIRQISHAYNSKESYASLLVRTLRKPIENVIHHEDETIYRILRRIRQITDRYQFPGDACVNHRVTYSKLLEIDNDLVQHIHLENKILFPKAISMEKELLLRNS